MALPSMIKPNDIPRCLKRDKAYIEIKYKTSLKGSDNVYAELLTRQGTDLCLILVFSAASVT